jgi:hypothetical protein
VLQAGSDNTAHPLAGALGDMTSEYGFGILYAFAFALSGRPWEPGIGKARLESSSPFGKSSGIDRMLRISGRGTAITRVREPSTRQRVFISVRYGKPLKSATDEVGARVA